MATDKKALQRPGFLFLTSYYEAIKDFPDNEMKWAFVEAVVRFGAYGEEPDFTKSEYAPFLTGLWKLTRPNLEKSIANYQNRKDKRKEKDKDKDKEADKDRDRDKERDSERNNNESGTNQNELEKRGSASRFTPPTLDEVKKYVLEEGLSFVNTDIFYNYYEACGWIVGNNKIMKDWKAAARKWNANEVKQMKKFPNGNPNPRLHPSAKSAKDFDEDF